MKRKTHGHYTELFFLDEATALANGHRPCAECQRERFNLICLNRTDTGHGGPVEVYARLHQVCK